VEQLAQEVRRQGRAALGAQAAAESCLDELRQLAAGRGAAAAPRENSVDSLGWLRALLPVFDAVDSSAAQAQAIARQWRASRWCRALPPLRHAARDAAALAEGIGLLQSQLAQALQQVGVEVDRAAGVTVDPARHRVLQVRAQAGTKPGQVLEVLRAGYFVGNHCLRETEVCASARRQH
jgi:molecular chaperone GrpE